MNTNVVITFFDFSVSISPYRFRVGLYVAMTLVVALTIYFTFRNRNPN